MPPVLCFHIATKTDPNASPDPGHFPPPVEHRLRAITALLLDDEEPPQIVTTTKISRFCTCIAENNPRLVSWNGRSFGVPVITYHALRSGENIGPLLNGSYLHRYGDMHIDLADHMRFHGASPPLSLDQVAHLLGLPGRLYDPYTATSKDLILMSLEVDTVLIAVAFNRWGMVNGTADAADLQPVCALLRKRAQKRFKKVPTDIAAYLDHLDDL